MSLWIYKCTNHNKDGGAQGDWSALFAAAGRSRSGTSRWGGSSITTQPRSHALARSAQVGQRLLCWQIWDVRPDYDVPPGIRAAAVGIAEIARITGGDPDDTAWYLKPLQIFDAAVPLTTYRASDPVIEGIFAFPRSLGTFDELSPVEERSVLKLCGAKRLPPTPRWEGKGESSRGGGFGDAEKNARVEAAAIDRVTAQLTSDGWAVRSVETDKVGYDLFAKRLGQVRHIEVKGVSGTRPDFIITANERKKARSDPHWEAWIVTGALTKRPTDTVISGADLQQTHDLKVIAYRATAR